MAKRLLMITAGYLPYQFSENLCNAKLVYALTQAGYVVDVISKVDEGTTYDCEWKKEWLLLKENTHTVSYPTGSKLSRLYDVFYSGVFMDFNFTPGVRWMRRAYQKALSLMALNHYDAILTRSPSDAPHYVGKKLKERSGIKWIANWNDPAGPIWPEPYKHHLSEKQQRNSEKRTAMLLHSSDINTFPSDSLRKHFISHFPFLKNLNTEVVPHIGLPKAMFTRRSPKHTDVMTMIHSGNMSIERNPENLFRAMRDLIDEGITEFRLDIMGQPNPLTEQLIDKYQLNNYVKIIGSFTYLDAVDKLQDYDVMVLLEAILENGIFFASKFTDYALTGKPILAISPVKGFANDMVSKYNSGIVCDNTSSNAIKDSLSKLISKWHDGTLQELSSSRLYKEFAPETVVKIYSRLLNTQK